MRDNSKEGKLYTAVNVRRRDSDFAKFAKIFLVQCKENKELKVWPGV